MTEQWIPARKAFEIIPDERALIARLRSGLLIARGDVSTSESKAPVFGTIRPEFWLHDPFFDFQSNWESGDFTNSLNGDDSVDALNVCIALTGLLEMVAFEDRGLLTRRLSVAANAEWMTAQSTQALLFTTPINPKSAGRWILEQARFGFVIARAVQAQCRIGAPSGKWSWEEREWDVPTWFWTNFTSEQTSVQDWGMGRFSGHGRTPQGSGSITLTGLHFHKATIEALLGLNGAAASQPAGNAAAESKRGRRPTYDWHVASSTIWGRLHRGDLKAKTQADIEQAFIAVLSRGGQEPSESTVRPYAKTIFEEYIKP